MRIIYDPCILAHNPAGSGEGSYRLRGIENVGICVSRLPDPTDEILRVHTPIYLRKFKGACKSKDELAEVRLSPESYTAALASVALSIYAASSGDFAVTRPPGHHATMERAKGFCFLNNIAIATQSILYQGKKVFIIDVDGHHGDGTERLFYRTDMVFYSSIHQQNAYPFNSGEQHSRGAGVGRGYTKNFPIPLGSGDDVLLDRLEQIAAHVEDFTPDVIGISAGFDGYHKDKLLGLNYSLDGFFSVGSRIRQFGIPTFAVLEGGYHTDVVSCITAFVNGFNGEVNGNKLF